MANRRLILIAGWMLPFVLVLLFFLKGRRYDPAFFDPPVEEVSTLPVPASIAGWMLENIQSLPADRMYEKINGRTDYYLQYGASGLTCGEWVAGIQRWDMYLYKFDTAQGARGAFAGERPTEHQVLNGMDGYVVQGQVAAAAGQFYLQLSAQQIAADTAPAEELAVALVNYFGGSENISAETEAGPVALAGKAVVPGSENFLLESAFGFSALNEVQAVRVSLDGGEAVWFSAAGGPESLMTYLTELAEYGGEEIFEQDGGGGGSMFGTWEFAAVVDGILWGVRDAPSKEILLQHWVAMQAALEEK